MPRKDAPEFSYDPKTKLYRKKIKDEDGRWIPVYGKTKAEVREKVQNRKKEVLKIIEERDNPLCHQYFASWYALWSPGKKDKYLESIRNAINTHILPGIGNMRMIDVTEEDLKLILAGIADKSRSLNQKVVRTLKMVFKAARKAGVVREDPAADLTPGGEETVEKVPLTELQQETLLKALEGTKIYLFVLLVLHSGLRREEALALKWSNIYLDVDHPYLSVRQALRWEKNQPIISDELKSSAARRDIPIPPRLVKGLTAKKKESGGEFVFGGDKAWTEMNFRRAWEVIRGRSVRTETYKDKDGKEQTREWKLGDKVKNHPIFITIDFHVTPHQLRHTYITRLILSGANIKIVQYLAGHAKIEMTLNIYTHLMQNRPQDTAASVLTAFGVKNLDPLLDPKVQ